MSPYSELVPAPSRYVHMMSFGLQPRLPIQTLGDLSELWLFREGLHIEHDLSWEPPYHGRCVK